MKNKMLMLTLFAMSVTNLNAGIIWSGPETEEVADRLENDEIADASETARAVNHNIFLHQEAGNEQTFQARRVTNNRKNTLVRSVSLESFPFDEDIKIIGRLSADIVSQNQLNEKAEEVSVELKKLKESLCQLRQNVAQMHSHHKSRHEDIFADQYLPSDFKAINLFGDSEDVN